jgi:hypothetical protein
LVAEALARLSARSEAKAIASVILTFRAEGSVVLPRGIACGAVEAGLADAFDGAGC